MGEGARTGGKILYVLKGFPRLSELFIASEIHRLEQLGLRLRLAVLKPADEARHHAVVDRIRAVPEYGPALTSLSGTSAARWLVRHGRAFAPALARVSRRRPAALVGTAAAAFAQAVRARRGRLAWPRKVYLKEWLQAVWVADLALSDPEVRHLHAHFAHGTTTVAMWAARMAGRPFSFTAHAKDVHREDLNPAGLLARKLRAARFAVTCTEASRKHLSRIAPDATVHCVHHGLNADFAALLGGAEEPTPGVTAPGDAHAAGGMRGPGGVLAPNRGAHRRAGARVRAGGAAGAGDACALDGAPAATPLRVLAVGRRVGKKGFDVLLRAAARLRARGVAVEVRLVGEDGEASQALRALASELGLGGAVRFVGPVVQSELLHELRRASVFCLPCRVMPDGDRDGIPNVLVESMACGVPAVTTPVGGIPELVTDGANGVLVPPDEPDAVADALECLARDPAWRENLGERARETVRIRFDGERLAARLAEHFAPSLA